MALEVAQALDAEVEREHMAMCVSWIAAMVMSTSCSQ